MKPTPRILAFDTSTQRGSIALLEGREVCAELKLHSAKTHSALLLESIDFLLGRLEWSLGDLDLVAVGAGPGSFTGIRIGVSTALGISQSLSLPFAGISGLDALAHQVELLNGQMGVLLDAHRSQVFYAEYISKNGRIRRSQKSSLIHISDLEHRLANRHLYVVGDVGAAGVFGSKKRPRSAWPRTLTADMFLAPSIGRLALSRKRMWRTGDFKVAEPVYIRPPDALRNRRGKH